MAESSEQIRRVLVIEDDPDQREIYSALLYYNGYDVSEAGSILQAVDAIAAHRPDVILLDIVLPDTNGLDAAALMKETPAIANIPIICMTAHDIHPNRALSVGCAELLRKPLNGSILVHAIQRALRKADEWQVAG